MRQMRGRMLNALIADYESIGVGAVILQVSDRWLWIVGTEWRRGDRRSEALLESRECV